MFQIRQKSTATPVLEIEHPSPSHLKPTSIPMSNLKNPNKPQNPNVPPPPPKLDTALAIINL